MTNKELLKMALEALCAVAGDNICKAAHHARKDTHYKHEACPVVARVDNAIKALHAAFAAPEAEQNTVTKLERIRDEERERCAQVVEQMTSRKRMIYGAINGEPVADCPIAAAIRKA